MKLESKSWPGVEHRRRRETEKEKKKRKKKGGHAPSRRPTFAYIGGESERNRARRGEASTFSSIKAIIARASLFEQQNEKLARVGDIYIEFSTYVKLVVWTKCARRASFQWQRGGGTFDGNI